MTQTTIDTVRRLVGRRSRISREEMATILTALAADGLDLRNDCAPETWDWDGARAAEDQSPAQIARAAHYWARMCRDITCISVMASGCTPHGQVRYDQPGSMAPMQHADLMFVSERLRGYEYDPIGYLRRHADRVLIVRSDSADDDDADVSEPQLGSIGND